MKGFKATIYIETEDDGENEYDLKGYILSCLSDAFPTEIKLIEVEEVELGHD